MLLLEQFFKHGFKYYLNMTPDKTTDMGLNLDPRPLAPNEQLPHRKIIRSWTQPFASKNTAWGLFLIAIDFVILGALLFGTVHFYAWWAKLIFALLAGFWIGRIFVIGHDLCHQAYFQSRKLNHIFGRICMLPSVSPYSLWDIGHNVVHHGYTNLKDVDFVWQPKSPEEYKAMSAGRKFLERIYRSGLGSGIYYIIEIWWKKMMFPSKKQMPTQRKIFFWDSMLCAGFGILWAAVVVWAAYATHQSPWVLLFFSWFLPLLMWFYMIGFVVYVHHTHTKVTWHEDKKEWAAAQPFVSTTVHLTFHYNMGALVHHIFEHTAHHVDMSIPLYHLKSAQAKLEHILPERIVIQPFSWGWYFRTAGACKLYDYKNKVWTDFDGNPITKHQV